MIANTITFARCGLGLIVEAVRLETKDFLEIVSAVRQIGTVAISHESKGTEPHCQLQATRTRAPVECLVRTFLVRAIPAYKLTVFVSEHEPEL